MLKDHINENCFAGVPVPQTQISMEEKSFYISEGLLNKPFSLASPYYCLLIYSINTYYTSMWFPIDSWDKNSQQSRAKGFQKMKNITEVVVTVGFI